MSEQTYTLLPGILLRTVLKPVILPFYHNYKAGDYSEAFLFFIFWLVALSGIFLQGVQA